MYCFSGCVLTNLQNYIKRLNCDDHTHVQCSCRFNSAVMMPQCLTINTSERIWLFYPFILSIHLTENVLYHNNVYIDIAM